MWLISVICWIVLKAGLPCRHLVLWISSCFYFSYAVYRMMKGKKLNLFEIISASMRSRHDDSFLGVLASPLMVLNVVHYNAGWPTQSWTFPVFHFCAQIRLELLP